MSIGNIKVKNLSFICAPTSEAILIVIGSFFGAYIVGSLEAGVVASGIGGYWTRLVTGLVMAASVSLNIILNKEKGERLKEKLKESIFIKKGGEKSSLLKRENLKNTY